MTCWSRTPDTRGVSSEDEEDDVPLVTVFNLRREDRLAELEEALPVEVSEGDEDRDLDREQGEGDERHDPRAERRGS